MAAALVPHAGPGHAKALYRWGQALHALQHLAAACPEVASEQAEALAGAAAGSGQLLSSVALPLPGALAPQQAEAEPSDLVLCSSPELLESTAGALQRWNAAPRAACQARTAHLPAALPCPGRSHGRSCGLGCALPVLTVLLACPCDDVSTSHTAGVLLPPRGSPTPSLQLDRWHTRAATAGQAPFLPGSDAAPRDVPLPVLRNQPRRHVQPLAPLLAAYMSQRWQEPPGAPLPDAEPEGEEEEEGEA